MSDLIILNNLEIKRNYEKVNDKYEYVYRSQINLISKTGHSLYLQVTPELTRKLIDVCADHIVATANEMAEAMKSELINGLVENKSLIKEIKDEQLEINRR